MNIYQVKITGRDVRNFIFNLYKRKIQLLDIIYIENYVLIKLDKENYKKLMTIKTIYDIEIVNFYGALKIKYFFKKYKLFIIFIILGYILFLFFTNIIFSVVVNTNDLDLKNTIISEANKLGIKKYLFSPSFSKKEDIKKELLDKYSDKVSWIEITRYGTRYVIDLVERKNNILYSDDKYTNVIAKKSGIIKKINAKNGEVSVSLDHYVKKGDVLISGIIHKKEDIVGYTNANGLVYAETWYNVTVELPNYYTEDKLTGKKKKTLRFKLFDKDYDLFNKYDDYNINNIFMIKNSFLPISLSLIEKEEITKTNEIYTMDKALLKAFELGKAKLYDILGKDIKIIYENNLKITEENSKIIVVIFYKVYENITDYEIIQNIINKEG